MSTPRLSLLVIADARHDARSTLLAPLVGKADVAWAPDVAAAGALLEAGLAPAVIALLACWPGEYSAGEVARLQEAAPLARLWGVVHTWCEGERRSGRPWPAVPRVALHQWPARVRWLLAERPGEPPEWSWPATADDEERVLARAERPVAQSSGLVVVHGRRAESLSALADAVALAGWTPVLTWSTAAARFPGAAAVLWDATVEEIAAPRDVRRVRLLGDGAPLVAVVGFPRPEDIAAATSLGASAVLAKPLLLEDLHATLEQVASGARA